MDRYVGVVGLGLMGKAFCERLVVKSHRVIAFNRTKREEHGDLVSCGVKVTYDIAEVFRHSDVILLALSDAQAIREVLRDAPPSLAGKTIVQMGTIAPLESVETSRVIEHSRGKYVEAPVMGSAAEIRAGTLIIMVGGDTAHISEVEPILKNLSSSIRLVGDVGSAAALKLAMNQLTAALTAAFSISLAFCREHDVDVDVFMGTLRESPLYAPAYDKKLPKYLTRDFGTANFSPKHLLKDIALFAQGARSRNLETSAVEGLQHIASRAVEAGFSGLDYSSIYNIIHPKESTSAK